MAALRHGIQTVIIPEANAKDLEEIDQTVRSALNFITVSHVDSVLKMALTQPSAVDETAAPMLPAMAELTISDQKEKPRKTGIRQ